MKTFYKNVRAVLSDTRTSAYRAVNLAMVEAYWRIGHLIVEEEQHGNSRAEYGSGLLKYLAQRLTDDFGKGFDKREMRRIRQLYLLFPIRDVLRPELTWTHYRLLSKIENADARTWYVNEAVEIERDIRLIEQNRRSG